MYLFRDWNKIRQALKVRRVYLFLDYDGTIAPIARTPDKVILASKTKDLLLRLSKIKNYKIAIVSGRSASDIKKRVGLKNIVYVGNHGLEIKGPKIKFKSPVSPMHRKVLNEIKERLTKELAPIKGALLEDKGFSLSVHYRLADKKSIPLVIETVRSITRPYENRHVIKVRSGKMVLEIRPDIGWDKGRIVLWLLKAQKLESKDRRVNTLPIYIGDDITDEDAFSALKDTGITVFVGNPARSEALFYLKNTNEVSRFLKFILKEKSHNR